MVSLYNKILTRIAAGLAQICPPQLHIEVNWGRMKQYNPYRYQIRKDRRKKKKRGPVQKAVILGALLLFLVVSGTVSYVVLDAYDYNLSAAFSDWFGKRQEETTQGETPLQGNANFLAIITANRTREAYAFAVIHAGLEEKMFRVVTIPPDTLTQNGSKEETLEDILFTSGAESTCRAVEQLTGLTIDRYVRATQGGFEKLVDQLGGVQFQVEKDLIYNSEELSMHVQGGEQTLTGSGALHVMRYPEWEQGEMYQYQMQARLLAALIDQHLTAQNAEKGDALFDTLINLVQSDISVADYRAHAQTIAAYAELDGKQPTQATVARGIFIEEENGKRVYQLTGGGDFFLPS